MTDRALETTTVFRELMAELTALDATFLDGPVPVADEQCSRATSGSSRSCVSRSTSTCGPTDAAALRRHRRPYKSCALNPI
jgi:hypothetical protein